MPFWSDSSEYGYSSSVNPTNRQLPGLGGQSWAGPVVAGEAPLHQRILGGLPIPSGDETDWDGPGEVIANVAAWGVTGETQSSGAKAGIGLLALAAIAGAFFLVKR